MARLRPMSRFIQSLHMQQCALFVWMVLYKCECRFFVCTHTALTADIFADKRNPYFHFQTIPSEGHLYARACLDSLNPAVALCLFSIWVFFGLLCFFLLTRFLGVGTLNGLGGDWMVQLQFCFNPTPKKCRE